MRLLKLCTIALAVMAVGIAPAYSQAFPMKFCHMQKAPAKSYTGTLRFKVEGPSVEALQWVVFNPAPPDTDFQQFKGMTISIDKSKESGQYVKEQSPEHRYIFRSLVSANESSLINKLSMRTTYSLAIAPGQLASGVSAVTVAPLSDRQQALYTAASETINYRSADFQNWISSKGLVKRVNEGDMDFAWRAFAAIRRQFDYNYDREQDRHISKLCSASATDCGGVSWMLVGVLRANGIPARSVVGRWLKNDPSPDNSENGYGQVHVKSEFFAKNVGWVPVEMSGAISDKFGDPLAYFGRFNGDFVVFHIDSDLVFDSLWFGLSNVRNFQSPMFWVTGKGNLNGHSTETSWQTKSP